MQGLTETIRVRSDDIKGEGDRTTLETALSSLEGVRDVEVDTGAHAAQITFDSTIIDPDAITAAVQQAGYSITHETDRENV